MDPPPGIPIKVPDLAALHNHDEIPAYPDRGVSVPAASPEQIYESQRELINRLHQASSFSHEDFMRLIKPAILNYAAYAHLLPASDTHHHCGQGGLFRHGIEVALNAAIACEARIFAFDHWASKRDKLVPRWRMCAILGGMIHDMGKPIIDIGAVDVTGNLVWNPHGGSLWDWMQEHNLSYYYIHWREGARHKRHEAFTALAVDRIIPPETMRWITEHGGQEPLDALIMSLSGSADPHNPLASIIKSADSKSVAKDITDSRARMAGSGMGGQRNLAARCIRAMYDMLEAGTWDVNRVGNPIWVTTEGVFGIYPNVIAEAIDALRANGDATLARDAVPILQSMADWGFVHPNIAPNGQSFNTWMIRISAQDRGKPIEFDVHVVRFSKEELIPTTMLPKEPVKAVIIGRDGKPTSAGGIVSAPNAAPTSAEAAPGTLSSVQTPSQEATPTTPAADSKPRKTKRVRTQPTEGENHALLASDGSIDLLHLTSVAEDTPIHDYEEYEDAPYSQGQAQDMEPLRDKQNEPDVRDQLMQEAMQTISAKWPPVSTKEAVAWFLTQGYEGNIIQTMTSRIGRGELVEGTDFFDRNDRLYFVYPKAFDGLGISTEELRNAFEAKGWVERDPATPNRSTVNLQVNGKRVPAIQFNENFSLALRFLLPARDAVANTPEVQPNKPRALPYGHYIDEHAAARFTMPPTHGVAKEDAPLVRPGFYNFLDDELKETRPGQPMSDWTPEELNSLIGKFLRMHRRLVSRSNLEVWLTADPNPILTRKDQKVFTFNPDYDREQDVAVSLVMEPKA